MVRINSPLAPFSTDAFRDGKFLTVTDADVRGKWSVFFFYPADFTFVCPTELEDLADNRLLSTSWALNSTLSPRTSTSRTRPGTIRLRQSARSSTRCLATRQARSPAASVF